MNEILMRAVVEYAIFLGLSSDEIVDPDAAVSQLEQLNWMMKGLSAAERDIFTTFIEEMANLESKNPQNKERVEFLQQLPDNLRLRE